LAKILVIDDEEDIRFLLKTILDEAGYEVETAVDAKDALAKMKKTKFDLAVIDFFMPEMSGRELLAKMKSDASTKDVKSVFLTAANFSGAGIEELKKMGCLDYIQKPIDNDDFVKRIKKAINGSGR
jgi:CheY-like chemotaxis protein